MKYVYQTANGIIELYNGDVINYSEKVDILFFSAFKGNYTPVRSTIIAALESKNNINIADIAKDTEIDLRSTWGVWLSKQLQNSLFSRLGCVETVDHGNRYIINQEIYIKNLFVLINLAANAGINVENIAIPIFGAGRQKIDVGETVKYIIRECMLSWTNIPSLKKIVIFEWNKDKFEILKKAVENSDLSIKTVKNVNVRKKVFISCSHCDENIARIICDNLSSEGMDCWFFKKAVYEGDYAKKIALEIKSSDLFIVIISCNSQISPHVRSEINIAFNEINNGLQIMPLKIDENDINNTIQYYLGWQNWTDASIPPIEEKVNLFCKKVLQLIK